ncbi:MAG: hypothetical protein P8Z00_15840 [Anaerolineales bacterium]|jgi:hypothetical protein
MPAIRERIYLCPEQNGQPGWIMKFPLWWDRSEFFEKFGDRQIDSGNPIYVNYGLLLTPGEARAWDKECRQAFAKDPRGQQTVVIEAMRQWDELIQTAGWVIVESYEWESGLE